MVHEVFQVDATKNFMDTEVSLETAGLPPRSGTLLCVPLNATMDTARRGRWVELPTFRIHQEEGCKMSGSTAVNEHNNGTS